MSGLTLLRNNEVIGVPFTVSTNVLTENPNIELDEQYIEYECFDGVTVFSEESEFINDRKTPKNIYTFDFDCENSKFIIHQTPESRNNKILLKKCDNSSSFKIIFLCFKNCFKCCFASLFHCWRFFGSAWHFAEKKNARHWRNRKKYFCSNQNQCFVFY